MYEGDAAQEARMPILVTRMRVAQQQQQQQQQEGFSEVLEESAYTYAMTLWGGIWLTVGAAHSGDIFQVGPHFQYLQIAFRLTQKCTCNTNARGAAQ